MASRARIRGSSCGRGRYPRSDAAAASSSSASMWSAGGDGRPLAIWGAPPASWSSGSPRRPLVQQMDDPVPAQPSGRPGCWAAARWYARRGRAVLPIAPGSKRPLSRHGVDDAACELDRVGEWFRRWPDAGVGLATGQPRASSRRPTPAGIVVLDVDAHGEVDGRDALADLERAHGEIPSTPTVCTGGGGLHFYFSVAAGRPIPSRVAIRPGLDVRGDGAYVVAPPSVHPGGTAYVWDAALGPRDLPMATCPTWLLDLADATPGGGERADYVPAGAPPAIPERARMLLQYGDHRLLTRYMRGSDGLRDTSASDVDLSLATLAARSGLVGVEIETLILASRARAKLPEKRASYYAATIGRALAGVQPEAAP